MRSRSLWFALFLPLAAAAHAAADPANTETAPPPPVAWTDCGNGVQCARVTVPLDYDRPSGASIEIAIARRPAVDAAHRLGSLFVHPGGPGGSGVAVVKGAPMSLFEAFPRFDVVGFDQRGLNESSPAVADCGDDPGNVYRLPILRPPGVDRRDFAAATNAYVRNCRAVNATLLPHLGTANVARDLDRLRAAVGDTRLNYLGISYGTVIGATYATLFPGRARAIVLDSPLDVQVYYDDPLRIIRERAQGHEDLLGLFLAACAREAAACGFGEGRPRAALEGLLERLDAVPIPSSDPADPRLLSGDAVRIALTQTVGTRGAWRLLADGLRDAAAGDGSGLLAFTPYGPAGADDDFNTAVLSVDQRFPRWPDALYFAVAQWSWRTFPHFWFATGYADFVRGHWLVSDDDAFRGRIRNPANAAPILVVASTHDASTPYFQALNLMADLGNARLLTFEGEEHGAVGGLDACLVAHAARYFDDGTLPPRGSRCVQQVEAFPQARTAQRWQLKAR